MKKKLLLIDGDQLLYQITSACEVEMPAADVLSPTVSWAYARFVVLGSDYEATKKTVFDKMDTLIQGFDKYICTFSTSPNFRHEVLPSYKGGRLKKRKPIAYYLIMTALQKIYPDNCRRIDGLEADDVMSIIATDPRYTSEFDITIWSQDKDMKQVPGVYLDNTRDTIEFISNDEANRFRYLQCLTGDTTDGYGGCPGYGVVKAAKRLDRVELKTEEDYLDEVISAYTEAGQSAEFALSQINCAFILRHSEYDFKNKQPILVTQ